LLKPASITNRAECYWLSLAVHASLAAGGPWEQPLRTGIQSGSGGPTDAPTIRRTAHFPEAEVRGPCNAVVRIPRRRRNSLYSEV